MRGKVNIIDLPYLNHKTINDFFSRSILIFPFYYNGEWNVPIPVDNEQCIITNGIPEKSFYLSEKILDDNIDFSFLAFDLIYKYLSWKDLLAYLTYFENDINNLFTSMAKINTFKLLDDRKVFLSDFVTTEIEYILVNIKSIFDYIQKIMCNLWNKKITIINGRPKNDIPDSFRRMIYKGDKILNKNELIQKYGLSVNIANAYEEIGIFFEKMKILRDGIVHHGKEVEYVFHIDSDFGIDGNSEIALSFPEVKKIIIQNNIIKLDPFLISMISQTINASNLLMKATMEDVPLPEPKIINYNVYYRNRMYKNYIELQKSYSTL